MKQHYYPINYFLIFTIAFFLFVSVRPVSASTTISISATVASPSSGGGGGGGYIAPTGVTFSGRAYPLSTVIILTNGQESVRTIAGPDARFSVSLNSMYPGTYTFSVLSEDSAGRRSTPFTFPISIIQGASVTISGIFLAPTIDVDKIQVKQGDDLTIFGQTAPESAVTISVHSDPEYFLNVRSDTLGAYLYILDTSTLLFGGHETKSKARVSESEVSSFSKVVAFAVGDRNIPKTATCVVADLNCDGRVNLIDFSILAFWYKRPAVPAKVDLNHDGVVSLVDFSIVAYYWTG